MKFDPAKDYYAILGVSQDATPTQIHHGYKKLVTQYHPDRHQGNELEDLAREKLVQVNEAYEVLSKSALKAQYDASRSSSGHSNMSPNASSQANAGTLRKWIQLILILVSAPLIFRFIRSPRIAAVIGIAILLAWFTPRLLKKFKK